MSTHHALVDGRLVDATVPALRVDDPGFAVGDGAFTTTVVTGGRVFALGRHLARLRDNLVRLGLAAPPEQELTEAVETLLAADGVTDAKLRVSVSAGFGGRPTVVVAHFPPSPQPDAAVVITLPWRRHEHGPLAGVKSLSFGEWAVGHRQVLAAGADEGLIANTAGDLCEGVGSNVFVVLDGVLCTPPLVSGCLAGVARAIVVEVMPVRETPLPLSVLAEAGEAFLTSSTRFVQPIRRLDGRDLPAPGPVTAAARRAFAEAIS